MATVYIPDYPPAKIKKAVQRRKSYMYACTSCKEEFYFCGMKCNYHFCPRCGRSFAGSVEDKVDFDYEAEDC